MGMWGNVGRERTSLGQWLQDNGKSQGWLESVTGLSERTVVSLCGDKSYRPSTLTKRSVVEGINNEGYDVEFADFW